MTAIHIELTSAGLHELAESHGWERVQNTPVGQAEYERGGYRLLWDDAWTGCVQPAVFNLKTHEDRNLYGLGEVLRVLRSVVR